MTLEDLTDLSVGDGPIDLDPPKQRRDKETRFQPSSNEMVQYNPFITRPNMTWDDRTMDRMITIKKPRDIEPGEIWLTDGDFAETMSLTHINKAEQMAFLKKFKRTQLMTGELSHKIRQSRQDFLMVELLTQKSRPDVVEGGNMTERDAWVTTKQEFTQGMHYPPQVDRKKGFFGSLMR
jgi:hypothetical protein